MPRGQRGSVNGSAGGDSATCSPVARYSRAAIAAKRRTSTGSRSAAKPSGSGHCDQPAAVLLDIEMPRMDGFQLLAAVRNELQLRELPVVMITSRIAGRHRQRAQELGASAYMGKPCREQELLSLLSGLCPSTSGAQDEGRMEKQSRPPRSEAAA